MSILSRSTTVAMTPAQLSHVVNLSSAGRYPEAYNFLADIVDATSGSDSRVSNWLRIAASINSDDGSFYSDFVRAATQEAGHNMGNPISDQRFQDASDALAQEVIKTVLAEKGVPSIDAIIEKDVEHAVRNLELNPEGWAGTGWGWAPTWIWGLDLSLNSGFYEDLWQSLEDRGVDTTFEYIQVLGDVFESSGTGLVEGAGGQISKLWEVLVELIEEAQGDIEEALRNLFVNPNFTNSILGDIWSFFNPDNPFDNPLISPLIIDLDGDGVELTSLANSQTHFDLDGNGFAQRTGWVTGDDAFLAIDRNGDGKINDINELFGNANTDGFTELSELDTNNDGVIDANDAAFASLMLWQDRDGDGVTDEGELISLADAGIASIDLQATVINETNNGHDVSHRSRVMMDDGSERTIDDVWFANDRSDTQRIAGDDEAPAGGLASEGIPYLRGLGQVADLPYAASQDPVLHDQIVALLNDINTLSLSDITQRFEEIVFRWTGAEEVFFAARGPVMDGRHVSVLEAFKDVSFDMNSYYGSTPGPVAGTVLEDYYQSTLQTLAIRFLIQAPSAQEALGIDSSANPFAALSLLSSGFNTDANALAASEAGLRLVVQLIANSASVDDMQTLVKMLSFDVGDNDAQRAAFDAAINEGLSQAGVEPSVAQSVRDSATFGEHLFVRGTRYDDTLQGDERDNVLQGGRGDDTYIWGRGQGNDVTNEEGSSSDQDKLILQGLAPDDIDVFRLVPGKEDVIIRIKDTGEQLIVDDQFLVSGTTIETIHFSDGTVWGYDEILHAAVVRGSSANETFRGSRQIDDIYLWGTGQGNDKIIEASGAGIDTVRLQDLNPADVVFTQRIADASDILITITATGETLVLDNSYHAEGSSQYIGVNRIEFADGTVWDQDDMRAHATLEGTEGGDTLSGNTYGEVIHGHAGDDTIFGNEGNDTISGGAGNDTIDGGSGNDTIAGGTGNDAINGGMGDDIYQWGVGDGHDVITDASNAGVDTLELRGLNASDVTLTQSLSGVRDLVITINATGETITLIKSYRFNGAGDNEGIQQLVFADGTVWDQDTMRAHAVLRGTDGDDVIGGDNYYGERIDGGLGNDAINGNAGNDVITGGAGVDVIDGGSGEDVYIWSRGDGNDVLSDSANSGIDTLKLNDVNADDITLVTVSGVNDILITINDTGELITLVGSYHASGAEQAGINRVEFADGTAWDQDTLLGNTLLQGTENSESIVGNDYAQSIAGGAGNDTIDGGSGNDTIDGGAGNDVITGGLGDDVYTWGQGDGHDTITDTSNAGVDTLELRGLNASDVTLTQSLSGVRDLVITINATGETITLIKSYRFNGAGDNEGIQQLVFADGTVWDQDTMRVHAVLQGTDGNNVINGDNYYGERIQGGAGNDTIDGRGGNDTITGGRGADTIEGGAGEDVYIWSRGDGNDVLSDSASSGIDTLRLIDVDIEDIALTTINDSNDLIMVIRDTGERIVLTGSYHTNGSEQAGINRVEFADGTVWDQDTLLTNTEIQGTSRSESINGHAYSESIRGGAGNDTINGGDGNDTISGDAGNDLINGGAGDDVYRWGIGDGHDTIIDGNGSGIDKLELRELNASDVSLTQSLSSVRDLVITINTTGETITLGKTYRVNGAGNNEGVQQLVFADGTVWDQNTMRTHAVLQGTDGSDVIYGDNYYGERIEGGAGNDIINGNGGSDIIAGGAGDDVLKGGSGNDIYLWGVGDGHDVILDSSSADIDRLTLKDLTAEDVTVSVPLADNGRGDRDIVITINHTGETITIINAYLAQATTNYEGVHYVEFMDGTVWNHNDLLTHAVLQGTARSETIDGNNYNQAIDGGAGNDVIYGLEGNDTIAGSEGNDILCGGAGDDTYIWGVGDGHDVINEGRSAGSDTLILQGLMPVDVTLTQSLSNTLNLMITINETGESITLIRSYRVNGAGTDEGVQYLQFADGTVWDQNTMRANAVLQGTDSDDVIAGNNYYGERIHAGAGDDKVDGNRGNDTILGDSGNDHLEGGEGNDTLDGGTGNDVLIGDDGVDTYLYHLGGGNDRVYGQRHDDKLRFGDDIAPQNVTFERHGDNLDVIVHQNGAEVGRVVLVNQLASQAAEYNGVSHIEFSDGTQWDAQTLANYAANQSPQSANDTLSVNQGEPLVIRFEDLLANDADIDGDTLSIIAVTPVLDHGTVSLDSANRTMTFTPHSHYFGEVSFDYTVSDGRQGISTSTVTVNVIDYRASITRVDVQNTAEHSVFEGSQANENFLIGGLLRGVQSIEGSGGSDSLLLHSDDHYVENNAGNNNGHYRVRDFTIGDLRIHQEADVFDVGAFLRGSNIDATTLGNYLHIVSGAFGSHRTVIFVDRDGQFTDYDRVHLSNNPAAGGHGADLFFEFQGYSSNNNIAQLTGLADNTQEQFQRLLDWGFLDVSAASGEAVERLPEDVNSPILIQGTAGADNLLGSARDDIFQSEGVSSGVESIRGNGGADVLRLEADDTFAADVADDTNAHFRIRDFVIDDVTVNTEADSLDISDLLSGHAITLENLGEHLHVISGVYGHNRSGIFIDRDGQFTAQERAALNDNPAQGGHGADLFLEFQGQVANNNLADITGYADNTIEQLQALIDMGFLEVS